ncbi:Acetyltransferase [Labilithrix luteola]|uniref:Acetyltransferase n=1 Tax=Labilithrix luteola TaxID=1391654 RepID=A0A0K1Q8Q3_9BACT|nr:GNAT family N-acetyltransferase [Labilithrix luteola]AKV02186.1 Acetyltransferase [Labilithrix luteola]
MSELTLHVEPFRPEHLEGFARLFEGASSSCFCRYWEFQGNKNEWLDRCAHRPLENFEEQASAVRSGEASALGLVALDASRALPDAIVGWMKLTWRSAVPKLRNLPVYRQLDLGPDATTLSVGCFLVHPAARGKGVARALLAGAEAFAREHGAQAIEGYPRRASERLYDEEVWQGPEHLFRELGYDAVHDVAPYPVYRKVIR